MSAEGWASMHSTQRSFHYYREGRALCGKWMLDPRHHFILDPGNRSPGVMASSGQDCAVCFRKSRVES